MTLSPSLSTFWTAVITGASLAVMAGTALDILWRKKDTRAAAGWLGLVWFAPLLGVCLYWIFGVNRIERKARQRFAGKLNVALPEREAAVSPDFVAATLGDGRESLAMLCRLTDRITFQPLMQGNRITPLLNGDQAYPRMLAAIRRAQRSVSLGTYIFDNDPWGRRFQEALQDAAIRGVAVKVLIDGVGARYSFPPITWKLRRSRVDARCFLQTLLPWRFRYLNLRNHRKILVVDGTVGFTGGINIRAGNYLADRPPSPIQDLHFQVEGPVVAQLQRVFTEDWTFTTGEKLTGPDWFPHLEKVADGVARGISDGPDENFDKLRTVILGAMASAHSSIRICTPYFLPDAELATGLRIAALRGVEVRIILPASPNLRLIKWASDASLEELLAAGCKISLTPPPFDHSKIMIVDNSWVLLGSANWDARSLVLNFEFNVECYDSLLAGAVGGILDEKLRIARRLTIDELRACNRLIRTRNKFVRLFQPYL